MEAGLAARIPPIDIHTPSAPNSPRGSSEDEDVLDDCGWELGPSHSGVTMQGIISKWTNYFHGWQPRFLVLSTEGLAYYKAEEEYRHGWRANIPLPYLRVREHSLDDCRMDVWMKGDDKIWYLRASDTSVRALWMEAYHSSSNTAISELSGPSPYHRGHRRNLSQLSGMSIRSNSSTTGSLASAGTQGSWSTRMLQIQACQAHMETFRENLQSPLACLENFYDAFQDIITVTTASGVDEGQQGTGNDNNVEDISLTHTEDYPGGVPTDEHPEALIASEPLFQRVSFFSRLFGAKERYRSISETDETGEIDYEAKAQSVTADSDTADLESDTTDTVNAGSDILLHADKLNQLIDNARSNTQYDVIGAAYTYKANADGFISALTESIAIMRSNEESWKRRVEREIKRRRRFEASLSGLSAAPERKSGPDFEEGPNCLIDEEEFFDAVDTEMDLLEVVDALRHSLRLRKDNLFIHPPDPTDPLVRLIREEVNAGLDHHLALVISNKNEDLGNESSWELLAEEGEMKVYRSLKEEAPGMVVTPLQALHVVKGVTAKEMADRFWDVRYREDFEHTIDRPPEILKTVDEDTVVLHQLFKHIWPASQRHTFFWSARRHLSPGRWIVVNQTCTDQLVTALKAKANPGLVQIRICIALLVETEHCGGNCGDVSSAMSRDQIRCHVRYTANVNPGGWAPASVLRAVYRREYPSFVRRFTNYVANAVAQEPIPPGD